MPESGLPIRVYKEHDIGTSTTAKARPKTTPAGRRLRPQPTQSHRPKSAPWSSRNNDLVAMLTSLDKFDHAALVGCCARRAEISVALPPKGDRLSLPLGDRASLRDANRLRRVPLGDRGRRA